MRNWVGVCLMLAACGSGSERVVVKDDKGRTTAVVERCDGEKHGRTELFDPQGRPRASGRYDHDRKNGAWISLDASGLRRSELHFAEGAMHGWQIYRCARGTLTRLERFDHGTPDGPQFLFDDAGRPLQETTYLNGRASGRQRIWSRNEDGSLDRYIEGTYMDGERSGFWLAFFGDGRARSAGRYEHGLPHGHLQRWKRNGAVETDQWYDHGTAVPGPKR